MGSKDVKYDVKMTHRGPLLESGILKDTQELFSNRQPMDELYGSFSFVWGSSGAGETTGALLESLSFSKNLFEFHQNLHSKA
jgi:hypothetical protein